eukprot:1112970-Pyramimonas_sp.AAC.1
MLLGFAPVAVYMCRPGGLWLVRLYKTRCCGSKYAPLRLTLYLPLLLPALSYLDIDMQLFAAQA